MLIRYISTESGGEHPGSTQNDMKERRMFTGLVGIELTPHLEGWQGQNIFGPAA